MSTESKCVQLEMFMATVITSKWWQYHPLSFHLGLQLCTHTSPYSLFHVRKFHTKFYMHMPYKKSEVFYGFRVALVTCDSFLNILSGMTGKEVRPPSLIADTSWENLSYFREEYRLKGDFPIRMVNNNVIDPHKFIGLSHKAYMDQTHICLSQ